MKKMKFNPLLAILVLCSLFALDLSAHEKKKQYSYDYQLAIAAIFSNEGPYLREWIEYHKLIGVEHFYLYNNLSSDGYYEVLEPYIKSHEVDIIDWPYKANNHGEWDKLQVAAYRDVLNLAKYNTKWLAIIDVDEFIVPVNDNNLTQLLKKYEGSSCAGVCLIWSFFGTSHVKKIPEDKLLIETLVRHAGPAAGGKHSNIWNQGAYKSIVRPKYVKGTDSPHYCVYGKDKSHKMLNYDHVHINHYWTRDEDYLNNTKIPRREFWGQTADSVRSWATDMNGTMENNPILRFVHTLKQRMGLP